MNRKQINTKNYVKMIPERLGSMTSNHLDQYTKERIEQTVSLLEQAHGLRYSRDLIIRRAILNYHRWIRMTVKRGNRNALDKEMATLIRISGRELAELTFSKPRKA